MTSLIAGWSFQDWPVLTLPENKSNISKALPNLSEIGVLYNLAEAGYRTGSLLEEGKSKKKKQHKSMLIFDTSNLTKLTFLMTS